VPPSKSTTLTEAELRLMDVFWQKDSATVQQVLHALPEKPALAYNSVLTTVRILEAKGYLKHEKDGRAHIFSPIVGRKEASKLEVQRLVHRFFGNSHERLVLNVIEDESLDASELDRLRQLLDGGGDGS
jgi:predicted transcriptional regulator